MKPRKTNGLAVMSCLLLATPVSAETLRVGYAAQSPTFSAPIDTAQEQGFFKQVGLDVVPTTFGGGAKLHAATIAGASDIGLGTGSDFAFIVKGAPEKCVYLVVDKPFSIGVAITNPAIKTPDDLKGRKIGVTSTGAYTYWFASELPHFLHWPPGVGITPVSVGGAAAGQLAALTTGQIDAVVFDISTGLQLQHDGKGRLLLDAADYVKDVVTTVVWAHNDLSSGHPDELRRFLAAMRKATDYLIDHRDYQVDLIVRETGLSKDVIGPYVDITNAGWSRTGAITPAQLKGSAEALVQAGLLESVPDLAPFYTAAFDPKS